MCDNDESSTPNKETVGDLTLFLFKSKADFETFLARAPCDTFGELWELGPTYKFWRGPGWYVVTSERRYYSRWDEKVCWVRLVHTTEYCSDLTEEIKELVERLSIAASFGRSYARGY